MWCSLSALSAIVSRRVWIKQGRYVVYPNLYVVLVGESGGRKTSATNVCRGLLRDLKTIPFSGECQTKESLVVDMSENMRGFIEPATKLPRTYCPLAVCVQELTQFIGFANAAHMLDFLTAIWEEESYVYKTKNGEKKVITIDGPYLTILSGTTNKMITKYLFDDVISGGFTRRIIFVYSDAINKAIAFPIITPEMEASMHAVKTYALKLMTACGEMAWSLDAIKFYTEWYEDFKPRIPAGRPSTPFLNSKHIQLLKIATLISLSESMEMILTKSHIEDGLACLQVVEQHFHLVYAGMGRNDLDKVLQIAVKLLQSYPLNEMLYVDWITHMYAQANRSEIAELLNHMAETQMINVANRTDKKTGAVKKWIQLRKKEPNEPNFSA